MSYTKKVIIKWDKDSYLQNSKTDRSGDQVTAMAELDAKVAEMISNGKMAVDSIVSEDTRGNLIATKIFTDQSAAEEWVNWSDSFASKYGFVKRNSVILSN